jgi:hypothetical protein
MHVFIHPFVYLIAFVFPVFHSFTHVDALARLHAHTLTRTLTRSHAHTRSHGSHFHTFARLCECAHVISGVHSLRDFSHRTVTRNMVNRNRHAQRSARLPCSTPTAVEGGVALKASRVPPNLAPKCSHALDQVIPLHASHAPAIPSLFCTEPHVAGAR